MSQPKINHKVIHEYHAWEEMGIRQKFIEGSDFRFKYGKQPVMLLRCTECGQNAFKFLHSPVKYTWERMT